MTTTTEHRHHFAPAWVKLTKTTVRGGRCACGMEVVGSDPTKLRPSAEFVRALERFQAAVDRTAVAFARAMERGGKSVRDSIERARQEREQCP